MNGIRRRTDPPNRSRRRSDGRFAGRSRSFSRSGAAQPGRLRELQKACAREKEEAIKYANSSLLERLVAIVDNFELGLSAARDEGEGSPIYSGMSLVLKQLNDFLAENGLQPIDAVGQNSIRTCTKPSRTSRARKFRKATSSARPGAVIVSKIGCSGHPAWSFPRARAK